MLELGTVVDGKYRIVRLLGQGGMGSVYEGQNLRIGRRVAIKVMHAAISEEVEYVARFEREAQAAARIGSSHIVDVLDLGDLESGERYMVMEYIEGESLMQRMRSRDRFTAAELAPIAIQLLEGLAAVHLADIVHRDLKPANVFLARTETGGDFVKILDFGVCKMSRVDSGRSTGVGDLLGTLSYMSPEQLEHGSKKLDGRADLYAVGVMLYRGLSGRMPFQAKNVAQLLSELRAGKAPPIEQAVEVDDAFAAIVNRATEWDPKARYQTAAAFQAALVEWVSSTTRVERLLTEFLDVAPVERSPPLRPPPRSASSPPTVSGDGVTKTGPQRRETRKMRATTSEPAKGQSAIEVEIPVDVEIEGEAEPDPLTVPKRRRPRTKRM